jgi:hypothetical protein
LKLTDWKHHGDVEGQRDRPVVAAVAVIVTGGIWTCCPLPSLRRETRWVFAPGNDAIIKLLARKPKKEEIEHKDSQHEGTKNTKILKRKWGKRKWNSI